MYKLTPDELAARKEIVVISDKGLRFRAEVKQEQFEFDDFHLPQINQQKDSIQITHNGEKTRELLKQDIKKDLNISRPYMEKILDKMTNKAGIEKPSSVLASKLNSLYQELERHTRLLEKRRVKFQKKHSENHTLLDQTANIERSELQDKVASLTSIEARLYRMQQNYQNELRLRDDTMKRVQQNMNFQRVQRQAEVEQPTYPVQMESLRVSYYNDRKQTRLRDYQKCKFEKIWNKQPPPSYTSKQALIEAEKKRQLQLLKEQQEYELELEMRNGQ